MITERHEELASLYVAGAQPPAELRAFEAEVQANPELQKLIAELRSAAAGIALSLPLKTPPPELKTKLLAQIAAKESAKASVIVPLPAPNGTPSWAWIPWAAAACVTVACVWLAADKSTLKGTLVLTSQQVRDRDATILELQKDRDALQTKLKQTTQQLTDLTQKDRLAEMQIAVLKSLLKTAPDTTAVSVWDKEQQKGVLMIYNLKELPANKDYQLWVIDPKQADPIDAGVFKIDPAGNGRFEFKPKAIIQTANKFAVTIEDKGGKPKPDLQQLVLIGG